MADEEAPPGADVARSSRRGGLGLALLVGLLTGFAAFGGVFLNGNFVLAGVLGANPVMIVLGTLLVVGWRNAGWFGLDRWFLSWAHARYTARDHRSG